MKTSQRDAPSVPSWYQSEICHKTLTFEAEVDFARAPLRYLPHKPYPASSQVVFQPHLRHWSTKSLHYRGINAHIGPSGLLPLSRSYTGKSAFRLPPLDSFSNARAIYGPTTGTFPTNPAIVAKKSPNSTKIPYSSTTKPISGHLRSIKAMPAANAAVPFHFCRRAKKSAVFWRPIIRVRPRRNRIW